MSDTRVVVVGAGPAGMRACAALVAAGLTPILIDEAARSGGRIYQQPPQGAARPGRELYGFEAAKAARIHALEAQLAGRIDHRREIRRLGTHTRVGFGTARRGDGGEIELAGIDIRHLGKALAQGVETDDVRIQLADPGRHGVHPFLDAMAKFVEFRLLLQSGTRDRGRAAIAEATRAAAELQARKESAHHERDDRQGTKAEQPRPGEIDAERAGGPASKNH